MSNKYLQNLRDEIKSRIVEKDYNFLLENDNLKDNICYLTLGGSFAYGTNVDTSDVDLRGISVNTQEEILLGRDHEETINEATDTTIYTVNKIFRLLLNVNPNTIELLFTRDEDIIYQNEIGKIIRDNRELFLSKRCINSFGGYANAQLRRLDNKCARVLNIDEHTNHIIKSMVNASVNFKDDYGIMPKEDIYLVNAGNGEIDIKFKKDSFNLRNLTSAINVLSNVQRDYDKESKRNNYAIAHNKIAKHMMHLVRLYLMAIELLKTGSVSTYRKEEHNFLMDIRNGKYLDSDGMPNKEIMSMVGDFEKEMKSLVDTTKLPEKPNVEAVEKLQKLINKKIVVGYRCKSI